MTTARVPSRPHILLLTLDQWRYDAAGFAGNDDVRTPHLDRLAGRGTVFEAAYTSAPLCVPARASLVSGRYGYEYGWQRPEEWIGSAEPTIPRLLGTADYRTVGVGKMHFLPFGESYGMTELTLCEHGVPEYYEHDDYHPWLRARGYTDDFELWQFPANYHRGSEAFRSALQALPSPLPEPLYSTTWIADRAIELIEQHDASRPLFLWISFLKPHHPFDPPVSWADRYDPAGVRLPDVSPGELSRLPVAARQALLERTAHGAFDLSSLDEDRLRRIVAYYYATISHVDHHVGRVLSALESRNMLADTGVLLTSDHGEFLGNRGQLFKDHRGVLLYEDLVRIPLVLVPPVRWNASSHPATWPEPVQHIDILPTVAELARVPLDGHLALRGRSLFSHITGRVPAADRYAVSEAPGGRSAALRYDGYKYIYDRRDSLQQLYDLTADPGERTNLADDPATSDLTKRMHRMLLERWLPADGAAERAETGPAQRRRGES